MSKIRIINFLLLASFSLPSLSMGFLDQIKKPAESVKVHVAEKATATVVKMTPWDRASQTVSGISSLIGSFNQSIDIELPDNVRKKLRINFDFIAPGSNPNILVERSPYFESSRTSFLGYIGEQCAVVYKVEGKAINANEVIGFCGQKTLKYKEAKVVSYYAETPSLGVHPNLSKIKLRFITAIKEYLTLDQDLAGSQPSFNFPIFLSGDLGKSYKEGIQVMRDAARMSYAKHPKDGNTYEGLQYWTASFNEPRTVIINGVEKKLETDHKFLSAKDEADLKMWDFLSHHWTHNKDVLKKIEDEHGVKGLSYSGGYTAVSIGSLSTVYYHDHDKYLNKGYFDFGAEKDNMAEVERFFREVPKNKPIVFFGSVSFAKPMPGQKINNRYAIDFKDWVSQNNVIKSKNNKKPRYGQPKPQEQPLLGFDASKGAFQQVGMLADYILEQAERSDLPRMFLAINNNYVDLDAKGQPKKNDKLLDKWTNRNVRMYSQFENDAQGNQVLGFFYDLGGKSESVKLVLGQVLEDNENLIDTILGTGNDKLVRTVDVEGKLVTEDQYTVRDYYQTTPEGEIHPIFVKARETIFQTVEMWLELNKDNPKYKDYIARQKSFPVIGRQTGIEAEEFARVSKLFVKNSEEKKD